jgi:hypothetical protein
MRSLSGLVFVLVFVAIFVFDTAALVRLTLSCLTGGCGVRPTWIAIGVGSVALAALLSPRLRRANAKITRVPKRRPSGTSRGKAGSRRKQKKANQ